MTVERRRDISILFGDPNRGMRMQYRAALRSEGFTQLHEFETLENFPTLFQKAQPDLIFMDAAMPGGNAAAIVHALRHGDLELSPFTPVIIATWDASRQVVHRIIDCGADDVLVKPLSTQSICGRIQALADNRKPFVVTADYIGPDRRGAVRSSGGDPPLLVVPNPLRSKMDGLATSGEDFRRQVDAMWDQIGRLRLRAAAFRIAFVAAQLEAISPTPDMAGQMLLSGLLLSAEDILGRLAGAAGHDREVSLCNGLVEAVRPLVTVADNRPANGQNSAEAIQSAAAVLLQAFHPERSSVELAADVAAAIGRYRARQAALANGDLPPA